MYPIFTLYNNTIKYATVSKAAFSTSSYWVPLSQRYTSQCEISDNVKQGLKCIKNALCPVAQVEHAKKMHLSIPKDAEVHLDVTHHATQHHLGPIPEDREYVSQSRQGASWSAGSTMAAITEFVSPKLEESTPDMSATDELRTDGDVIETGLNKFLERPVKIFETQWAISDALRTYNIYPWKLYLRDPVIADKVNNYAFIQGNMKIKVLINGTQWHYGKSILSYRPMQSTCELERAPGNAQYVDNIAFSQRPNVVIDPTESEAGEMTLPFINYRNWLDLSDTTLLEDMGELVLSSYNPLSNAAGGTEGVTITIFAYMTDVKLSGPTSYQSQSATQKGEMDEYGDGVVSRPATAVAKFARQLTSIPVIGPYARATDMGASAVSSIARIFGFSRPINVTQIDKYRPTFMGNIANDCIPEAVDKLTIDPKQELTVDPRVTGYQAESDELNLKYLAGRESYVGKFRWNNNNLVDSLLWNTRVTPNLWDVENNVTFGNVYHQTPMSMCCQAFDLWRGTMEFRFDICASKFHKGRLRFVWDPLGSSTAVPEWAAAFNRIIDLSQERSFTVTIGMNQDRPFLSTGSGLLGQSPEFSPTYEQTTPNALTGNSKVNGVLRCYVLNRLVAPDDATDNVEINVFAKMCDDVEFAIPTSKFQTLSYISQSAVAEDGSNPATTQEEVPVSDIIGPKEVDTSDLIHFGETITSLRQCLKRYQYTTTRVINTNDVDGIYGMKCTLPDFPAAPGEINVDYGVSKMTLLTYLTPCFIARRGGIRWKYNLVDPTITVVSGLYAANNSEMVVYRDPGERLTATTPQFEKTTLATILDQDNPPAAELVKFHPDTSTGAYVTLQNLQNAIEVEIPMQTNIRFLLGKLVRIADGTLGYGFAHALKWYKNQSQGGTNFAAQLNCYCAAGEDFSLSMFCNVPPMYFNDQFN